MSVFVLSKSRLSYIKEKTLTTQRLELQTTVTASRLKDKIVEIFDVQFVSIKFWVDSHIALKYIQNTNHSFPIFVMNHLYKSTLNSNVVDWNFISGNQNPADLCTRDISFSILKYCKKWFYGPEQCNQFIKSEES